MAPILRTEKNPIPKARGQGQPKALQKTHTSKLRHEFACKPWVLLQPSQERGAFKNTTLAGVNTAVETNKKRG